MRCHAVFILRIGHLCTIDPVGVQIDSVQRQLIVIVAGIAVVVIRVAAHLEATGRYIDHA